MCEEDTARPAALPLDLPAGLGGRLGPEGPGPGPAVLLQQQQERVQPVS